MMQYMSQAFFFSYKDWRLVKKAGGKFFAEKTKKKSKYLLTDRNIGVSMYPY